MNATIKKAELVKTLFQIEEAELLEKIMLSIEETIEQYKGLAEKESEKTLKTEKEVLLEELCGAWSDVEDRNKDNF
jgi:hypothetical protein